MGLTTNQLRQVQSIIRDNMLALVVETVGPEHIPHADLKRLVDKGVLTQSAADTLKMDYVHHAYLSGVVVTQLAQLGEEGDGWSWEKTEDWLRRNPTPLTAAEQDAVASSKRCAAQYVQNLGDEYAIKASNRVTAMEGVERRRRIGGAVVTAVEERQTRGQLASILRSDLGELQKDVDRVAAFELQTAHNEGTAGRITRNFGKKARVAKVPSPGHCRECGRLYLEAGVPKIFPLAQLAGATNFKTKRADWVPTVEATHPFCHCTLVYVPVGWVYDDSWKLVPEKPAEGVAEGLSEYERHLKRREKDNPAPLRMWMKP